MATKEKTKKDKILVIVESPAKYILPVISKEEGYIASLDALKIGEASVKLGAGRVKKEDSIDKSVGIVLNKKVSNKVKQGDILAFVYANDETKGNQVVLEVLNAYRYSKEEIKKEKIIIGVIWSEKCEVGSANKSL